MANSRENRFFSDIVRFSMKSSNPSAHITQSIAKKRNLNEVIFAYFASRLALLLSNFLYFCEKPDRSMRMKKHNLLDKKSEISSMSGTALKSKPDTNTLSLAFGNRHASVCTDIDVFSNLITAITPTMKSYKAASDTGTFFHRSAYVEANDLWLAATVCSPIHYEVSSDNSLYFFLSFSGDSTVQINGVTNSVNPHLGAFITPSLARSGTTTDISMLQAKLNLDRLKTTAATMLGAGYKRQIEDRFKEAQILPFKVRNVRFDRLFSNLCKTVDHCELNTDTLNALGFDDTFYRAVTMMVFPEIIEDHITTSKPILRTPIEQVCEFIDAHLTEAIYLTDLEKISGLSTRSLQYAFLRRFNCTPTTYMRQRRLELAHRQLINAASHETVTSIAVRCGFNNPSSFARLYAACYGEQPSTTLKSRIG